MKPATLRRKHLGTTAQRAQKAKGLWTNAVYRKADIYRLADAVAYWLHTPPDDLVPDLAARELVRLIVDVTLELHRMGALDTFQAPHERSDAL